MVVDISPGAGCVVCFVLMCVLCLSCLDAGTRKEKNERHFAWLLIALLVCHNLIHVCDCFSLVFVWHLSLFSFRSMVEPLSILMVP